MESFFNTLKAIDATFGNSSVLLLIFTVFLSFKMVLIAGLIFAGKPFRTVGSSIFYLTLVLIATMAGDITWILKSIIMLKLFNLGLPVYIFCTYFSWMCVPIQYQSLALFLENLIRPHNTPLKIRQKFFIIISGLLSCLFIFLAATYHLYPSNIQRITIERITLFITMGYALFPLMLSTIFVIVKVMHTKMLPRILHYQLTIFLGTIIIPIWMLDFLQAIPIQSPLTWVTNSFTFLVISNFLLMFAALYSARKIMGMRFLNLNTHVYETPKLEFIQEFREVLARLSRIKKEEELGAIVQEFFRTGFQIEPHKVYFVLRTVDEDNFLPPSAAEEKPEKILDSPQIIVDKMSLAVETFLTDHPENVCHFIADTKILIYDEIAFDNFYDESLSGGIVTRFLENVHLDIFLPIYYRGSLTAYIAIERDARIQGEKLFYTDVERGKILVFGNYLSNVINIMQNKNVDLLLQKENRLKHELFQKQQELDQYRECIQSFVRTEQTHKAIGIMFYKNRHFTFGNAIIEDLIKIDPNIHHGHPITQTLRSLIVLIQKTGSAHSMACTDNNNDQIIFTGLPSIKGNNIIITVCRPEISDMLMHQKLLLSDSSDWDFLLYLETTKHGKLINQLIPGSGKTLIAFKIKLLKIALSKKPTLLFNMPDADLQPLVQLLHDISLRETLHIINITQPLQGPDLSIKLFGISPILSSHNITPALLSQLDKTGTLFIRNVHFLPQETQEYLTEFIKTGVFRAIKSDHKVKADVRIICSVDKPIEEVTANNMLCHALFSELLQTSVTLPLMHSLSESELCDLATGFSVQEAMKTSFKNLLVLNNREKNKLNTNRPASIAELKNRVRHMLIEKTEKNEPTIVNHAPAHEETIITTFDLSTIALLGKNALKNKEAMDLLWKTFNNQNQIAAFLKVNRSSVNRRCKEYELQ